MPRADILTLAIKQAMPEWSSTRMSRWLGVSSRTLQRWLATGSGQIDEAEIPADLRDKITQQAHLIEEIDLAGQLDHFIKQQLDNGVDREVLAAWMAHRYKVLVQREID